MEATEDVATQDVDEDAAKDTTTPSPTADPRNMSILTQAKTSQIWPKDCGRSDDNIMG